MSLLICPALSGYPIQEMMGTITINAEMRELIKIRFEISEAKSSDRMNKIVLFLDGMVK